MLYFKINRLNLTKLLTNYRIHFYILATLWLLLQLFFLKRFGIVTGFEAPKYIEQAHHLIAHGSYTSKNFLFYSTEILLIALSLKAGLGFGFVVLIQLIINAISIFYFYKTIILFTRSNKTAFFFTVVFLSMIYYHLYNVHLFTESLYYSFSIIYAFFLLSTDKLTFKTVTVIILFNSLLYFTRPTGIFFIPATIIYIILKFFKRKAALLLSLVIIIGGSLLYLLLNFAMGSGGEFDFLLPYSMKMVICGVPTVETQLNIALPGEKNSLSSLWFIITNHTYLFLSLALKRLITFWGVVRPFYSLPHNLFIAVYFYGIYFLALSGLKRALKYFLAEIAFFSVLIILVMLTAMLSCDEWHNRFILSLLPYFLFIACIAIYRNPNLQKLIL